MNTAEETRKRIITASLKLFNRDGAHSVTTNHIAKELEMSPGNLYYHFGNKQEIIRQIFILITSDFAELWNTSIGDLDLEGIRSRMDAMADLYYRYRFFYLELPTLIAQDTQLGRLYAKNQETKMAGFETMYAAMRGNGIINDAELDPAYLKTQIVNSWIVSDFWLSYLAVSGKKITPESVRELTGQFMALMTPFIKTR